MFRRLPNLLQDPWFVWTAAGVGLLTGLFLWVVTLLVSRSQIHGHGWSLAGNGALIVPFGVGPALVAAGWAAIILRLRGHPRWLLWGGISGLVGLFFVACSLLSLVLFGAGQRDAGATGSIFFGFLLYGWLIASAIAAAMIPAPDPARKGPPFWSIVAFLLVPVSLIAGCQAGAMVLPG